MTIAVRVRTALMSARSRVLTRRRDSYRAVFGMSERSLPQARVLADLARFCRAQRTCFDSDARAHALLEGRREVWLRIQQMLNLTDDQVADLTEEREEDDE